MLWCGARVAQGNGLQIHKVVSSNLTHTSIQCFYSSTEERRSSKPYVVGSSPARSTMKLKERQLMTLCAAALLAASLMSSPTAVNGSYATSQPLCVAENSRVVTASWYKHGKTTANGEHFNPEGLTAAHKKLPFGTILLLTHEDKSVIVRINDRGPFIKGREIDLSKGAAEALGCIEKGVCDVQMTIMY